MRFNKHLNLGGTHAFLSPSNYHWINYDEDKLARVFASAEAARRGTEMHELAARLIKLGVRLPDTKNTINMYVNDCIGFKMTPEQVLFYSVNCYGTADAITFRRNRLHIYDLKNGTTDGSREQLEVYAAIFCLEYGYNPLKIEYDLRIYQHDDVFVFETDPDTIMHIVDRIRTFDRIINEWRQEAS